MSSRFDNLFFRTRPLLPEGCVLHNFWTLSLLHCAHFFLLSFTIHITLLYIKISQIWGTQPFQP
jgi:hypothetical protein